MKVETLAAEIIREQSLIVGENLAKIRAEGSGAVKFNSDRIDDLVITQSDPNMVMETLINAYEELFGQASVEVCVEVIKRHTTEEITNLVPEHLKQKIGIQL